jgi:ParB family transcriptional regulator, chromosome partitioning protein
MSNEIRKKVLGKGLTALLTSSYGDSTQQPSVQIPPSDLPQGEPTEGALQKVLILMELSESIKQQGVLQPIVVTRRGDKFQIICGERRLRASALAELQEIPAIVKEVANDKLLELALVENIQREDLNPIEESLAYARLVDEQKLSQEEVSKRVGKNRSTVANSIRLLRLPKEVKEWVANGLLSAGHARTLLPLPSPEHQRVLAKRIVKEGLSVRRSEELVDQYLGGKRRAKRIRILNPYVQDLEKKLEQRLGTHVRVFHNKKNQGRVEMRYHSLDDLDRLLSLFGIPQS